MSPAGALADVVGAFTGAGFTGVLVVTPGLPVESVSRPGLAPGVLRLGVGMGSFLIIIGPTGPSDI